MAANGKANGAIFPEWDFSKVWAEMKMPEFDVDALIGRWRRDGRNGGAFIEDLAA